MAMSARFHRGLRHGAAAAGYTLLEMIVVLGIFIALCGISAAVYQKLRVTWALPAATSQVSSVLRAARNYSVASGLPSRVFVEPAAGRITAFGYELVAGYHFEDVVPSGGSNEPQRIAEGTRVHGAFNEMGEIVGEVYMAEGQVGQGLDFVNRGAAVITDYRASYYSPRGFSLDAWVYFDVPAPTGKQKPKRSKKGAWSDPRRDDLYAVLSLRGSYELGLLGDGAVYVIAGNEKKEHFCACTRGGEVVMRRWTHLRASFDGLSMVIEVDGIARGWCPREYELIAEEDWPPLPPSLPEPAADAHLTVSRPDRIFHGLIDEPMVRIALPPRTYQIDGDVRLLGEAMTIHFDSRGSLDPERHTKPVLVRLTEDKPSEEAPATTGVGAPTLPVPAEKPGMNGAPVRGEEKEVADVLEALAQYLREKRGAYPDGIDPASASASSTTGVASGTETATRQGRIETIIVDLTGTIRRVSEEEE